MEKVQEAPTQLEKLASHERSNRAPLYQSGVASPLGVEMVARRPMHRDDVTEKLFGQLRLHLNLGLIVDVASQRVGLQCSIQWIWPQATPSTPRRVASVATASANEPMYCIAFLTRCLRSADSDQYWYPKRRRMILK